MLTAEQQRLDDAQQEKFAWKKWGPYLSERQWGTVRNQNAVRLSCNSCRTSPIRAIYDGAWLARNSGFP